MTQLSRFASPRLTDLYQDSQGIPEASSQLIFICSETERIVANLSHVIVSASNEEVNRPPGSAHGT
jgi:hypothetical protein